MKMKKNKSTKVLFIILSILLLFIICVSVFFYNSIQPVSDSRDPVKFEIKEGESTRQILENLLE